MHVQVIFSCRCLHTSIFAQQVKCICLICSYVKPQCPLNLLIICPPEAQWYNNVPEATQGRFKSPWGDAVLLKCERGWPCLPRRLPHGSTGNVCMI